MEESDLELLKGESIAFFLVYLLTFVSIILILALARDSDPKIYSMQDLIADAKRSNELSASEILHSGLFDYATTFPKDGSTTWNIACEDISGKPVFFYFSYECQDGRCVKANTNLESIEGLRKKISEFNGRCLSIFHNIEYGVSTEIPGANELIDKVLEQFVEFDPYNRGTSGKMVRGSVYIAEAYDPKMNLIGQYKAYSIVYITNTGSEVELNVTPHNNGVDVFFTGGFPDPYIYDEVLKNELIEGIQRLDWPK